MTPTKQIAELIEKDSQGITELRTKVALLAEVMARLAIYHREVMDRVDARFGDR